MEPWTKLYSLDPNYDIPLSTLLRIKADLSRLNPSQDPPIVTICYFAWHGVKVSSADHIHVQRLRIRLPLQETMTQKWILEQKLPLHRQYSALSSRRHYSRLNDARRQAKIVPTPCGRQDRQNQTLSQARNDKTECFLPFGYHPSMSETTLTQPQVPKGGKNTWLKNDKVALLSMTDNDFTFSCTPLWCPAFVYS